MNALDSDDSFLNELRVAPPAEFAEQLRRKLKQQNASAAKHARQPLLRAASVGAAIVGAAVLLSVPGVRAAAKEFLELFRAKNLVAVQVDRDSIETLSRAMDLPKLIGDQSALLTPPATKEWFATPQLAARSAGFSIGILDSTRSDLVLTDARVLGPETWQVTAAVGRLREVTTALNIRDLRLPTELDGKVFTFTIPTRVQLTYNSAYGKLFVSQMPIPTFELPANLDLPALGEIGLRILGKSPGEARSLAQSIDWRTTLLLPLPPNVGNFRQVMVQGRPGLAIELRVAPAAESRNPPAMKSVLIWSDEQFMHAMQGAQDAGELMVLAETMQSAR
jgi:hypothetical protein